MGSAVLTSSTGSVILGGFINAAKMASTASGRDARDHRVVFLGGGSAAVGYVVSLSKRLELMNSVAKEMMNYFTMLGLSEQEARERFWLIDTKACHFRIRGKLVLTDRV